MRCGFFSTPHLFHIPNMTTQERYYKERLELLEEEHKKICRKTSKLYLIRFAVFVAFISMAILTLSSEQKLPLASATILLLLAFITIAIYDQRMESLKRELQRRITFNKGEICSLNHDFSTRESGDIFTSLNPHLSADFDIFGCGSLFQYLNRSVTYGGKSRFAHSLALCNLKRETITSRAEAIEELSTKREMLEDFFEAGTSLKESGKEVSNLLEWLKLDNDKLGFIHLISIAIPTLNVLLITLATCGIIPVTTVFAAFGIWVALVFQFTKKLNIAHSLLAKSSDTFNKYSKLIDIIENEQFSSQLLNDQRARLLKSDTSASHSIKRLKSLLNRFDFRLNIIASVVLNGLTAFDLHSYIALVRWKEAHKECVEGWFDAIVEIDSLQGFAIYSYNSKGYNCHATLSSFDFAISATDMGHPLISDTVRVDNTIEISGRPAVVIITGANMAGKSTFLRTLAVNMTLAMNGAPVCAKSFSLTPVKILSSIKIQDSLMNRESYFYAELLRLSNILEEMQEEPDSLIILDEILRGTNTKDKQEGSIGLLRKIIESKGAAIIATHDLVIGKLEEEHPKFVSNHCFEVEIDGDKLSFDYKLKRGISSKLNASFLMRRMGIID